MRAVLLLLLACAEPPTPMAPATHSWQDEARLVADGLNEVERLWEQDQRKAARMLAERVYTERWEPRLERAERELEGPVRATRSEYAWGQLLVALEGRTKLDAVKERTAAVEDRARQVAEAAARSYPPPPEVDAPAPLPVLAPGSKPVVPSVRPAWEEEPAP
jgi:hypothetical protein